MWHMLAFYMVFLTDTIPNLKILFVFIHKSTLFKLISIFLYICVDYICKFEPMN